MNRASPLDVVLGRDADRTGPRSPVVVVAWAFAIAAHAALVFVALRSGPSLEAWSAELALEVHEALVDDQVIELATPPSPAVEPAPPPPRARSHENVAAVAASAPTPLEAAVTPPAAAADVVTQDDAPIDLTGSTIVTGTATTSLGGATSTTGTANEPSAPVAAQQAPAIAPSTAAVPALSRPVQLDAAAWRCAWPSEAISQEIYEQAVVLRVVVRADGGVEAAQLVDDPGAGFGPAALACAKRTRFIPALDAAGTPTRALSPPIRVRFTR